MTTLMSTTCRRVARQFIAGVLTHASEITAITNQWVNSYKRLIISQEDQPLIEAPVFVSWAQNNRSALIRVPPTKKGKRDSTRIEYRSPDPGTNPYLAWAVILAAGLAGIRGHYELPREASANIYQMSAQERVAEGIKPLPASLAEALDAMETSELVAETSGRARLRMVLAQQAGRMGRLQGRGDAVRTAPLPHLSVMSRRLPPCATVELAASEGR